MGKEWVVAGIVLVFAAPALAQPTFKLGVPPHLQPQATIKLDGNRIARSPVKDDPGFRLQFHVQKDGKTLADLDARASASIDVLKKEPGVYTVALELFYPSYKPGKEQKGHFLPISDSLTSGPYESAVSTSVTPRSRARRSVAIASRRSGGGPNAPGPVIRMAPKPRR